MRTFLRERPTKITEYNESLVWRLIEKVTIYKDEFTMEFTLPTHDIPVQIKARVVRVVDGRTHDEPTMLAVSFVQIDSNVSKIISGFVLENLSSY